MKPNNRAFHRDWIDYLAKHEIHNPYAATLQFRTTDKIKASRHIAHFKNRYRRRIRRRHKRINFVPVLETKGHLHCHLILSRPDYLRDEEFIEAVEHSWDIKGIIDRNKIVIAKTIVGWSRYITKFNSSTDEVDVTNLEWESNQVPGKSLH
jgi:hypothetical protein